MTKKIKDLDPFFKNVVLVFSGTTIANVLNLLYQLIVAHRLSASDFAAFNSLLAVVLLLSTPLTTFQISIAKYTSGFAAQAQWDKVKILLSNLLRKAFVLSILTCAIFMLLSPFMVQTLKIPSVASGYMVALLIGLSWLTPLMNGGLMGLELFRWFTSISVVMGILKVSLAFIFILLGFKIAGVLAAFVISQAMGTVIALVPLRSFFSVPKTGNSLPHREVFHYLVPVSVSFFCFISLVSLDMVLVKYFFSAQEAGEYALAQMLGKIFLFLPGAISTVLLPRTSSLNACRKDTQETLRKSLFYALALCACAMLFYQLFPAFTLGVLTGKALPASILIGRLFSISMSFYALLFLLINYFLSIHDLRFLRYLVIGAIVQPVLMLFFHTTLIQVQSILCVNASCLFSLHLYLAFKKKVVPARGY